MRSTIQSVIQAIDSLDEGKVRTGSILLAVAFVAAVVIINRDCRRCFMDGLRSIPKKNFWALCQTGLRASNKDFKLLDLLCLAGLSLACALTCLKLWQYGQSQSLWAPFILMYPNWVVVVLGVGDQIIRNHRSGRAHEQMSRVVVAGNFFQNLAWILVGYSGDIVYVLRSIGVIGDQLTFGQIMISSGKSKNRGRLCSWICSPAPWFLALSLLAVFVVPLRYWAEVQNPAIAKMLRIIALGLVLVTTIGWADQLRKNWLAGVLTGKDYSLKVPLLIELSAVLMMVYEELHGKTGSMVSVAALAGLIVNTTLLLQCLYFRGMWLKTEREPA